MLTYLGCALVVSGFGIAASWRARWILLVAAILSVTGIVLVVAPRASPTGFTNDDVGYVCRELSARLDDDAFDIVFQKPQAPRAVDGELRARHSLMLQIFRDVAPVCVKTPDTCDRILASADPTRSEFQWHVNYVAWKMRRREACEVPVPRPPPDYPWGPRR